MEAVQQGDAARVDSLLAHGLHVDARDAKGQTPLCVCVADEDLDGESGAVMWEGPERDRNLRHSNRIEVIKALLAHGADPNTRDSSSKPLSVYAILRQVWTCTDPRPRAFPVPCLCIPALLAHLSAAGVSMWRISIFAWRISIFAGRISAPCAPSACFLFLTRWLHRFARGAGVQDREVLQLLAANGLDPHAMEHVHKQPLWALALDRGWTRSELALLFHDL